MRVPPAYDILASALRSQWQLLLPAVADPEASTGVEGWSVGDLEQHLSSSAWQLADQARARAALGRPVGLAGWAKTREGLRRRQAARAAPLAESVARASAALETDPGKLVKQQTGVHTFADAVLFRLIEAVVLGLDLGVAPARPAAKLVVKALAGLLADTSPGASVEVRVPPYAAVQCLAGPRHTRGTPPNTVETDADTFLRLATGRLRWADASSRVRATGDRAQEVGGLLPLFCDAREKGALMREKP